MKSPPSSLEFLQLVSGVVQFIVLLVGEGSAAEVAEIATSMYSSWWAEADDEVLGEDVLRVGRRTRL